MAEFAACYGVPDPEMPWPLFLALVVRAPMFQARAQLTSFDGVALGIGAAFGGDGARTRGDLVQSAYPVKRVRPQFIRNLWREAPVDA